jgi:hypothetical protein
MRRDPAEVFDILPCWTIIDSEGMYLIGWIRIHFSSSADFRRPKAAAIAHPQPRDVFNEIKDFALISRRALTDLVPTELDNVGAPGIELVGHVSGLSETQFKQIEKSLPSDQGAGRSSQ